MVTDDDMTIPKAVMTRLVSDETTLNYFDAKGVVRPAFVMNAKE